MNPLCLTGFSYVVGNVAAMCIVVLQARALITVAVSAWESPAWHMQVVGAAAAGIRKKMMLGAQDIASEQLSTAGMEVLFRKNRH